MPPRPGVQSRGAGAGGGLDFCLESTAGAQVAGLWGISPVGVYSPTPAPPHRVPSPDHTEMLLLCSLGSPVQGQVCPEALSTLVLGLSPRA